MGQSDGLCRTNNDVGLIMARIRTIKPEFWTSEQVTECSLSARLLFIGMWNFADDGGNLSASRKTVKMQIFPADNIDVNPLIDELLRVGLLVQYRVSDRDYWHITGWKHQVINRKSPLKYPAYSLSAHVPLTEHSREEGKGRERIVDLDKSKSLSETSSDEKPKPKNRISYGLDFELFWKGYPTDRNMSKKEALNAWKKLTSEKQDLAIKSLPAFRTYCQSNSDYRPIHACRYLSYERFEGHAQTVERMATIASVSVSQNTPAGKAWEAYTRDTKGKGVPWTNGAWRFPTEFPPQLKAAE